MFYPIFTPGRSTTENYENCNFPDAIYTGNFADSMLSAG